MDHNLDINNLANYGLKLTDKISSNLKCAELFFKESSYINIELEQNSIKNNEIGTDVGISIRVVNKNGSHGFAFTNRVEKKSIEKLIYSALKMMNAGVKDPDFKNFPDHYNYYPNVKGLCDNILKNLEIEESLKYVEDLFHGYNKDEFIISQSVNFISNYTKTHIFNSNGLEIKGKETRCTVSSNVVVKDKISNATSFGYDWHSKRALNDINIKKIVLNALEKAKRNLNPIKVKTMKGPLILTPLGAINFILNPISLAINAETYQYNRSFLIGKRGERLGSLYLNVEDNALINGAIGSCSFDGEGVPCKNKNIFKNGKFLKDGLLHNSYTAGKENIESTGNASRNSYSSIPSIGSSNLILKPGDFSRDNMISDIKEGILLEYTGDSPTITTGDFSGLIVYGCLIENGEIKESLKNTMFSVNLLELFKNIDAVSKEFEIYGSFQAPFVRIKDFHILGG